MKISNETWFYLIGAFGFSWLIAISYHLAGGKYNILTGQLIGVLYMFGPMISAIFVQILIRKEKPFRNMDIKFKINKWFIVAWILPLFLSIGAFAISLLMPGVIYSPEMTGMFERFSNMMKPEQVAQMKETLHKMPIHPFFLTIIQGLFAGLTINAIAGFGEEMGWRGIMYKQMEKSSFWKASIFIGFFWGLWHFPLIIQGHNYPQNPLAGAFLMILWCIMLSPVFQYIRIKSGSVVAASILHGTINGTAGLGILLIQGGSDLTVGITGLSGFVVLLIINICLIIYDKFFGGNLIAYSSKSEGENYPQNIGPMG